MLVTLNDGSTPYLYDTEMRKPIGARTTVFGGKHGLRLHVYDPITETAYEKFVTHDRVLQTAIMREMRSISGQVNNDNSWIKPVIKRQEFWDTSNERRMVKRDLETYFGDTVTIRGISKRYIYYISDGSMSKTPDAIGRMFGYPLVYKGLVMATVFDIDGLDPLKPGSNVVHWLTKPMWDSFHTRFRRVPKEFPWPTGFVASYWCQREGYGSYIGGGIRIASMTQGQSVGRWASTSLRQFHMERQGRRDIFARFGDIYRVGKNSRLGINHNQGHVTATFIYAAQAASGDTPYGFVGLRCAECSSQLEAPYSKCGKCGSSNSTYDLHQKTMCTKCGKVKSVVCKCGSPFCSLSHAGCDCDDPSYEQMTALMHKAQRNSFMYSATKKGEEVNVIKLL